MSDTPPSPPSRPAAPDPSRRRTVGVVAAIAAALGAGVSWRTHRDDGQAAGSARPGSGTAEAAPAPAAGSASAPARAPARIATLDGRVLTPADWQGRPLVLNFWAPWCGPCVKEMPDLDRFYRSQGARGALVVGLAIDEEPAVRKFLAAHPVSFPVAVRGFAGLSEARALADDANVALPFTAVFAIDGTLSHRKFGATDVDELSRWVRGGA